jgi:hypothetical protein
MRHRKFYDIRSNVTRRASPGKYGSAHVVSEVSLGCSLGHPGPITLFPAILFSWGAPSIITQPFFPVISDIFVIDYVVLYSNGVFYHVRFLTGISTK